MRVLATLWCLAASLIVPSRAGGAEPPRTTRVLVVHHYSMDMPFRAAFDLAFQKALRASVAGHLEVYSEALETYRFPALDHSQLMQRYLREKYDGRHLNVVIAVYGAALDFVRAHHDDLFPGVPVVALTSRQINRDAGENLTWIWTGSNLAETAHLALQLHPRARTLLVVDGAYGNSGTIREGVGLLRERDPQVSVTHLKDRSLTEVTESLKAAAPDSVVLYIRQLIGAEGETIDQTDGLTRIARASALPVYGTSQSMVGSGLIGGYVSSVEGNARRIAALAAQVAGGVSAAAIPPATGVLVPVFDGREIRRRGIDERRLPPGSQVLFKESSLWDSYRGYVWGAAAVFGAQGLLIGALLLQRQRRRSTQLALRHSEARNKATLRAIPDLMFLVSRDGVYLDCHARNPEELYVSPEHFLGKRIVDVMPPDLAASFMRELALARPDEEPRVIEYPLAIANVERQFEARLVACEDDKVLSIVRDITEEKRAHADVVLSRQRYAMATSASGAGVWDWNPITSEFYIDSTFMAILGYDDPPPSRLEELMQYVHPADRAAAEASARRCAESRAAVYTQEQRMICRDGSARWFKCRGTVIDSRGDIPSRVVGTFFDITDLKDAETALRESEAALRERHLEIQDLAGRLIAAQEAERARLARDLHDDMSQRLALLTIDIDQIGRGGGLPAETVEHLRLISQRAGEIASDVHLLSYQLHPTKLQTLGLVTAIQSVCRDVSNQHGIDVEFHPEHVPPGIAPEVALCLYRIVQESLRNVVKHSGARRAFVRLGALDGELRLSVADQGKGFDIATTARTGLGLVSMRERVNFVGGEIVVHSNPGHGARIGVRVPVAGVRAQSEREETAFQPFSSFTVLRRTGSLE
jgi:PAS domain S-box-containing protein